jgi:hypothetical protein
VAPVGRELVHGLRPEKPWFGAEGRGFDSRRLHHKSLTPTHAPSGPWRKGWSEVCLTVGWHGYGLVQRAAECKIQIAVPAVGSSGKVIERWLEDRFDDLPLVD